MTETRTVITVNDDGTTRTIWRPARPGERFEVADGQPMTIAAIDRWQDGIWVRERRDDYSPRYMHIKPNQEDA